MPKLLDRNRPIPNGLKFYQPETKWSPTPWASFQTIVKELIQHRHANPFLKTQHGWPTDPDSVANEVDNYNAILCQKMGWSKFITEGGADVQSPKRPSPLQKLKNVVVGGATVVEWIASGTEAVPLELSNERGRICSTCPQNKTGDLTSWFTVPVSAAIRRALESRKDMNLTSPYDHQIGVCEACSCPLKLKIHMPIVKILERISSETKKDLVPFCWILAEENASTKH